MSEKKKNTGGSKQLKEGRPKTTDVAGPKKFKNKQFGGSSTRDFMQGLEAIADVPRMGKQVRDPRTGKEMSTSQLTDTTSKRKIQNIIEAVPSMKERLSKPKVTMDKSVAMKRARDADTSAKEDFKKGGKVKKNKKPKGCGIARQGVRKAKMITMKGS